MSNELVEPHFMYITSTCTDFKHTNILLQDSKPVKSFAAAPKPDVESKSDGACCKCRVGFCDNCQCAKQKRSCHSCISPNCENTQVYLLDFECSSCTKLMDLYNESFFMLYLKNLLSNWFIQDLFSCGPLLNLSFF